MPVNILIFSEISSPRLAYTCRLIFDMHLGFKALITIDYEEFLAYPGPKVLYRTNPCETGLHIAPAAILFEGKIETQAIDTCFYNGLTVPFATGSKSFPFDPLGAIFYLISRYEEYLPFEKNQYGQFKAANSLAFKLGFLEQPVVDIWINDLKTALLALYPAMDFKTKKAQISFTYDIDVAYAYLGRSVKVTTGNFLRELFGFNFKKFKERLLVLMRKQQDPFDTYDHILQQKAINGHQLIFFFLLGEKNAYNHNVSPNKKVLQELIQRLSQTETIGIHPSYYADTDDTLLVKEKEMLETISKKNIVHSRQHYLRLSFPVTYNNLIEAGIKDDYTLGFAELPGFRAGTCSEFYFYDLQNEMETALLIHPVSFMEGTFIEDMKLTPGEALIKMKQLMDVVKKVNGHCISIWHNHSLSDRKEWKGMKAVHDAIALYAKQ
jgi:hypothetical protein